MTITQYTIEPWQLWHGASGEIKVIASDNERTICDIVGDTDIDEAHGRLIAAAPELLEAARKGAQAIKDIIGAAENGEPYTLEELINSFLPDHEEIELAIAKARGEV